MKQLPINRRARRVAQALALALLLVPGVALAAHPGPLEFYIRDPETRELLGIIDPGDTLYVGEGQMVLVHALVREGRKNLYPRASYEVVEGNRSVSFDARGRHDEGGTFLLRGERVRSRRGADNVRIRYSLLTELNKVQPAERVGELRVVVVPHQVAYGTERAPYRGGYPGGYPSHPGPGYRDDDRRQAFAIVDALYQGILLRRAEGAQQERVESIVGGGWSAVEQLARDIALSEESRSLTGRVGDEQRLSALYRHLLGRDPWQVPREEWEEMLSWVRRGRTEVVVASLVRNLQFAERWDLDEGQRYSRSRW